VRLLLENVPRHQPRVTSSTAERGKRNPGLGQPIGEAHPVSLESASCVLGVFGKRFYRKIAWPRVIAPSDTGRSKNLGHRHSDIDLGDRTGRD